MKTLAMLLLCLALFTAYADTGFTLYLAGSVATAIWTVDELDARGSAITAVCTALATLAVLLVALAVRSLAGMAVHLWQRATIQAPQPAYLLGGKPPWRLTVIGWKTMKMNFRLMTHTVKERRKNESMH